MNDSIDQRLEEAIAKAKTIPLLPCPHCGAPAVMEVAIWGSSGEDRLGAFVTCDRNGAPLDGIWCWAKGASLQESPSFIENVAKAWNRRVGDGIGRPGKG